MSTQTPKSTATIITIYYGNHLFNRFFLQMFYETDCVSVYVQPPATPLMPRFAFHPGQAARPTQTFLHLTVINH